LLGLLSGEAPGDTFVFNGQARATLQPNRAEEAIGAGSSRSVLVYSVGGTKTPANGGIL
jgi:hypothetical protein